MEKVVDKSTYKDSKDDNEYNGKEALHEGRKAEEVDADEDILEDESSQWHLPNQNGAAQKER